MDKRYQVFVSSTYEDLREERQEVMQALLELDCIPSGMELFPAANEDQWTLIKKVIDDCDYYLVIIGGRYGSVGAGGKSYTQMEYEYAVSKGKPTVAFLHADPGAIAAGKSEKSEDGKRKLDDFRELTQKKMVKHWKTPHDLGSVVSRSLVKLIKNNPATGWVRADEIIEGAAAAELLRLRKEIEELQRQLSQSSTQAPQGTEHLSSGNEKFPLEFHTRFRDSSSGTSYTWEPDLRLTWNSVFEALAPLMIDRATTAQLRTALVELCRERVEQKVRADTARATEISISVASETMNIVIIQMRALGLIKKDERQRSLRDTSTYWSLTSYGDTVMTRLKAIRRKSTEGKAA